MYRQQIEAETGGKAYQVAKQAAENMGGLLVAVVRQGMLQGFHPVMSVKQPHGCRPQAWLIERRGRWVLASGSAKELEDTDEPG